MIINKKTLALLVAFVVSQVFVQGVSADTSYRVKSSDNLNKIAEKHYEGSGLTKSQILVGLYASNPKAFKNGNINKLLRGQKIVLPDVEKIDQISDHEAELVLSARTKSKKVKKRRSKKRTKSKRKRKVRSKKKVVTKRLRQTQMGESSQKIDKLEKESESLRKRLDALLAEKSASDNKLKELENSLQKVLKKSASAATTAATITKTVSAGTDVKKDPEKSDLEKKSTSESELVTQRANEKLRETNTLLEKNLQESKKEIANRTRENLAKEHAIKTAHASELQETSATFDTSNKYLQWALLSLLLFPLIWFAKRLMGAKKVKEQPAWVTENQGGVLSSSSEHIDTHYQEAPVESSIKLDVASAYLESGNTDEAMELLNEIMSEGNAEQQAQAQDLLNRYS